ncbi:MAG: hypothetical protein AMXMBFR64_46940 [Myxococcales bacterium]
MRIFGLPAGILVRIGLRNLLAHKAKTLIVGAIILFGTALVVVGNSLLDSVNSSMSQSIVGSLAGHIQVYSKDAKDELALFGDMLMGEGDIGTLPDFTAVKEGLSGIENIESIVPMGLNGSIVFLGSAIEERLRQLRAAVRSGDPEAIEAHGRVVRQIVTLMQADFVRLKDVARTEVIKQEEVDAVSRAASDAFWEEFRQDPLSALEYLENQVGPLAIDSDMVWLRYIGTDLDSFARNFDRFEIVKGTAVPPGKRGFLFSDHIYEQWVKHRTARRLDSIKKARDRDGKTIAEDSELQQMVKRNVSQYKEIVYQIDPLKTAEVVAALRESLGSGAPAGDDLIPLVQAFLDMDDSTFDARYKVFYDAVAPHITLYRIPMGEVMTITAFTKSGYMKSVNVKVYGTFQFKSLEDSDLAGSHNLIDLMTFRDLYGYRTEADAAEIAAIKQGVGAAEVTRENAEDALFGGDSLTEEVATTGFDEFADVDLSERRNFTDELLARTYSTAEIEHGIAINAAVILKDPSKIQETMAEIRRVSDEKGLNLKVVDWQTAAGLIGQFITVIRIVLYVAIFIIFAVALVIINNSMVMATMERVREIGTMRAIGAQRGFVMWSFLVESGVQGTIFGLLGIAVGSGIVLAMGSAGIPATSDIMRFLFGGPRLHPFLAPLHLIIAFGVMFVVSALSTFYPAFVATRITPLEAMQKDE